MLSVDEKGLDQFLEDQANEGSVLDEKVESPEPEFEKSVSTEDEVAAEEVVANNQDE